MWSPSKPKKAAFWCLKYLCHHLVLKFHMIWILRVVQWQVCEQLRSPCSRLSTRTRGSKASKSPTEDFYSGFMRRLFRTFAWIFESVWSCSNFTAVNTHTHTHQQEQWCCWLILTSDDSDTLIFLSECTLETPWGTHQLSQQGNS